MPTATNKEVFYLSEFLTGKDLACPITSYYFYNNRGGAAVPSWVGGALGAGVTHQRLITADGAEDFRFDFSQAMWRALDNVRFTIADTYISPGHSQTVTRVVTWTQLNAIIPTRESFSQTSTGQEQVLATVNIGGYITHSVDEIRYAGQNIWWDDWSYSETHTISKGGGSLGVPESSTATVTLIAFSDFQSCYAQLLTETRIDGVLTTDLFYGTWFTVKCDIVWEGPLKFHVNCAPTDFDGNPINGLRARILPGPLYTKNSSGSLLAINRATATDDGGYLRTATTPINQDFIYDVRTTYAHAIVTRNEQLSVSSGSTTTVYEKLLDFAIRSRLTTISIDFDRTDLFGLPPAAHPIQDFGIPEQRPHIRYHPDADTTCKALANIVLPQRKNYAFPTAVNWTKFTSGSSITDITGGVRFTVPSGPSTFEFDFSIDTSQAWNMRPYRWFAVDYNNTGSSDVTGYIDLDQYLDPQHKTDNWWYIKRFNVTFEPGAHTYWIDTLRPDFITTSGSDVGIRLQAEAHMSDTVTFENQGVALTFNVLRDRWSGLANLFKMSVRLSTGTVEVTNPRMEVRYKAVFNQNSTSYARGSGYQAPSGIGAEGFDGYNTWGHVDGRDAFRILNFKTGGVSGSRSMTPHEYVLALRDVQNFVINSETDYALNSSWLSTYNPHTWNNINFGYTNQSFGFQSSFESGGGRVAPIDPTTAFDLRFTAGMPNAILYLGCGQTNPFTYSEAAILDCEMIVGHVFQATDVLRPTQNLSEKGSKLTALGFEGDDTTQWGPIDYTTGWNGYGEKASKYWRPRHGTNTTDYPNDNQHFAPDQASPIVKQGLDLEGARSQYWFGFAKGAPSDGAKSPSYDVADNLNHIRSYVSPTDQKLYFGWKQNAKDDDWIDREVKDADGMSLTDPVVGSCVRVERSTEANRLIQGLPSGHRCHLLIAFDRASSDDVVFQYTDDYGQNWSSPITLSTTGRFPGLLVTRKGLVYAYWLDAGGKVKRQVFDKSQSTVIDVADTNISIANCDGIAVGEYFSQGKIPYITMAVADGQTIKYYKSTDGLTFS